MRHKLTALASALLLSGCVTSQSIDDGVRDLFLGKTLDDAIRILGYPTGEQTIAGHKLYVWDTQRTAIVPHVATTQTYGNVGQVPVYGASQTTSYSAQSYQCILKLEVDGRNYITAFDVQGSIGGCSRYSRPMGY